MLGIGVMRRPIRMGPALSAWRCAYESKRPEDRKNVKRLAGLWRRADTCVRQRLTSLDRGRYDFSFGVWLDDRILESYEH